MTKKLLCFVLSAAFGLCALGCRSGGSGNVKPDGNAVWLVVFAGESVSTPFQEVKDGEYARAPADPVRDGYDFDGWYLGNEKFDFERTPVYGDITLTGKWTVKQTGGEEQPVKPIEPALQTIEMLRDRTYAQGFRVTNTASNLGQNTYLGNIFYTAPYDEKNVNFQWTLAQWGIKKDNLIQPGTVPEYSDGKYWFTTASQRVGIDPVAGEVYMEQNTSLEYERPRRDGEDWPHMLIEQGFNFDWNNPTGNNQAIRFNGIEALRLKMDFTVHKAEQKMSAAEYNSNLHAAQFQWYSTVHNVNPDSPDYGNCMWFGFQFYDNRNARPGNSVAVDGGKDDASGLAIVVPRYSDYLDEPVKIGTETHLNVDVLAMIAKYLSRVKEESFKLGISVFQNTEVGDLALTSMNLGWELPGTFDVQSTIRNLSIEYDVKR